jgi:hypothetical protein
MGALGNRVPISTTGEAWNDGALTTNPSANDILATTGQLGAGKYFFHFLMHCTADATFVLVQRNATDTGDVHDKEIPIPADSEIDEVFATPIVLAHNERVVVRCKGNVTGNAQASIFSAKVV